MHRLLVDEDLPRSLAPALRHQGFDALDVRDIGLRGRADAEIANRAAEDRRAVLTADLGFANILRFPLGSHAGMVVVRFPNEVPVAVLNQAVIKALQGLTDKEVEGSILVVEPGRTRLRSAR